MMNLITNHRTLNITRDIIEIPTSFQFERQLDIFLAILHLTCFIFGTSGNVLSFSYFIRQKKDLSTCIYIVISGTDFVISLLTLPVSIAYFSWRNGVLFNINAFCIMWGSINTIVPHLSVFLVATLSITRTISLINPLNNIKRRNIFICIFSYVLFLVVQGTLPIVIGETVIKYLPEDTYCWADPKGETWRSVETILDVIELGFPVIPIVLSCAISTYRVLSSRTFTSRDSACSRLKFNASLTIIIFTLAYIIFNIPVFIQFLLYMITIFKYKVYPGPLFQTMWMRSYSWNVVFVLCVALNALVNPIIYYTRIRMFRIYVGNKLLYVRHALLLRPYHAVETAQGENSPDTRIFTTKNEVNFM